MSRRHGRPPRADGPAFDREVAEQLIRHGEVLPQADGPPVRRYPGVVELGRRFGVSASTMTRFARTLGVSFAERRRKARPARPAAPRPHARVGRRPKDAASIPWTEVDKILVEGEPVRAANKVLIVVYPEAQELAQRYGVHPSTISRYATAHRCYERRLAHRKEIYAGMPVQVTEYQAKGAIEGTATITGDPDDDLILARRVVVRNYRMAAEAGEVRANDPVVVRESDRLGREAHDRKHGGETENDFQLVLAAARARALEGRRRFEALPAEATGRVIEVTAVEVSVPVAQRAKQVATPDPSDAGGA